MPYDYKLFLVIPKAALIYYAQDFITHFDHSLVVNLEIDNAYFIHNFVVHFGSGFAYVAHRIVIAY